MRISKKYLRDKAELFCARNNCRDSIIYEAEILSELLDEIAADQRQACYDAIMMMDADMTKQNAVKVAYNAHELSK